MKRENKNERLTRGLSITSRLAIYRLSASAVNQRLIRSPSKNKFDARIKTHRSMTPPLALSPVIALPGPLLRRPGSSFPRMQIPLRETPPNAIAQRTPDVLSQSAINGGLSTQCTRHRLKVPKFTHFERKFQHDETQRFRRYSLRENSREVRRDTPPPCSNRAPPPSRGSRGSHVRVTSSRRKPKIS